MGVLRALLRCVLDVPSQGQPFATHNVFRTLPSDDRTATMGDEQHRIFSTKMPTRPFIPPRNFRAILRRVIPLTPSTKHFEWELLEGGPFEFYAGQFVSLEVPRNGGQEARPYSIASAPRDEKSFDLCLNRVEGGFVSNYLCDIEPGTVVGINGPHGSFVVSQPVEQDLVFIATGTGIAPIRGML